MDALKLLEADHQRFRALLGKLEDTTDRALKTRGALFQELRQLLIAHETVEEEILYPQMQKFEQAKDIVGHSYEEHHVIDLLLDELSVLDFGDKAWGAKAHVLGENLEHHLKDEERDLFPKVRRLLDDDLRDEIGSEMRDHEERVLRSAAVAPSAKAVAPRKPAPA